MGFWVKIMQDNIFYIACFMSTIPQNRGAVKWGCPQVAIQTLVLRVYGGGRFELQGDASMPGGGWIKAVA